MKIYQLSELDAHIMFRGEWLKYLGIPVQNISEGLYRQKSSQVDLQSGEQIQQFYFLNAFILFWKGLQVPLNQDVKRKSKQRLCARYSQVVKCWQLSRVLLESDVNPWRNSQAGVLVRTYTDWRADLFWKSWDTNLIKVPGALEDCKCNDMP